MHIVTIIRYYLGLTQVELAKRAGISFADLNEIEQGQVYGTISKFRKLAEYLHVPVHTVVTNDILSVPEKFFKKMRPAEYQPPAKSKNGTLGREGEDAAFILEKNRIASVNPLLSKLIIPCYKLHAARGGYDIISYKNDGTPIFIEVKTSEKGSAGEFQLTKYEFETAKKLTESGYEYWIYYFSNWNSESGELKKVSFRELIGEERIEPVRYQCNIRPQKESETGILHFRKQKGVSQIDAANIMEIPVSSLCAYESGDKRCPVTAYEKMSRFYGVKIDDLLKEYPTKTCG